MLSTIALPRRPSFTSKLLRHFLSSFLGCFGVGVRLRLVRLCLSLVDALVRLGFDRSLGLIANLLRLFPSRLCPFLNRGTNLCKGRATREGRNRNQHQFFREHMTSMCSEEGHFYRNLGGRITPQAC